MDYEQKLIDAIVKSIHDNNKYARGQLAQSVKAETVIYGQHVVLEVSMLEYWKYVEYGRAKGSKQPPQDAMLAHIRDRGKWHVGKVKDIQNFYKNKKGLMVKRKKPLSADKARKTLAFLIGRKIAKNGIEPSGFLKQVKESSLVNDLEKELLKTVGREIKVSILEGI